MSAERRINFNWSQLSQDTTILLTFSKLVKSHLTSKENIVAWKVIDATAPYGSASVLFPGRFGFAQGELNNENMVRVSTSIEVPLGFKTDLIDNDHGLVFQAPVKDPQYATSILGRNRTGFRQSMSVGTLNDGWVPYSPAFFWAGVGDGLTKEADFPFTLMVHAGKEYKEGQLITEDLTSDALWSGVLAGLSSVSVLDLVETTRGKYEIRVP